MIILALKTISGNDVAFQYSTEKQWTGKYWNNKKRYIKTINNTLWTGPNYWKQITNGLNADLILSYEGYLYSSAIPTEKFLLPYADVTGKSVWFKLETSTHELNAAWRGLTTTDWLSGAGICITIEYTEIE